MLDKRAMDSSDAPGGELDVEAGTFHLRYAESKVPDGKGRYARIAMFYDQLDI